MSLRIERCRRLVGIGGLGLALVLVGCSADDPDVAEPEEGDVAAGEAEEPEEPDEPDETEEPDAPEQPEEAEELTVVRPVAVQIGQSNPLFVMTEQGIDERHGLDVQPELVATVDAANQQMQMDDFTIGFGAWLNVGRLRASGVDLVNIGPMTSYVNEVLVPNDSPAEDICDLRGLTVGLFGGPAAQTSMTLRLLTQQLCGFDLAAEADLVGGAPPLLASQLEEGGLDAALLVDPVMSIMMATGEFRSVGGLGTLWRQETGFDPMLVSIIADEHWAAENPETVTAFLAAYKEAIEFLSEDDDVWTNLAAEHMQITDPEVVTLLRERQVPAFLTEWDQEYIDSQQLFLDEIFEHFGELDEFPRELPEGTFTTEYTP